MEAKRRRPFTTIMFVVILLGLAAEVAAEQAPAGNNPVDEKWWPSEFGPNDQAGATNWITPESRIAAAKLVKRGVAATLGMPYHGRIPLFPGRTWALSIPGGERPHMTCPGGITPLYIAVFPTLRLAARESTRAAQAVLAPPFPFK